MEMEDVKGFRLLKRYILEHLKLITMLLLGSGIFMLVFYLYNIPFYAYSYAVELTLALAFVFASVDFIRYSRRHKELCILFNKITVEYSGSIKPFGLLEEDYQRITSKLFQHLYAQKEKEEAVLKMMLDYYTLWAHQIKNPITAMRLLIQVDGGEKNGALLQQLLKIERYVGMVLQYLRTESMSADLKFQEYKVLDLVKKAVKQDSSVFIYNKITLNMEEMEDVVLTDEKWLVFVIEQILSNALKYTNVNQGVISIYMDRTKRKTLIIEDNGTGIAEDDLPRIFENGFTGYNGRMGKKSTGIGLYLCKKIMDYLGHSISVISKQGQGTQVYLGLYRDKLDTE